MTTGNKITPYIKYEERNKRKEEGRRDGNWELGYDDAMFDADDILSKLK